MEVIFPGNLVQIRDRGLALPSRMIRSNTLSCIFQKERLYGVVLAMIAWKDVNENIRRVAKNNLIAIMQTPSEFTDLHCNEVTYVILIGIHHDSPPIGDAVSSFVNEIVIIPNDRRFAAVMKANA